MHYELFRIFARYIYYKVKLLTNIISEYLKHNKRLVVPKLGTFIVKAQGGQILFSELMRSDDGVLRSLLMAYGMKELEANGLIDRMVFEIRHAVGRGESFTIEGFGDFIAGPNNTITFRHKREKVVVGGNIKPPVETLIDEQRKMQRARKIDEELSLERSKPKTKRKPKVERVEDDEESITMIKPDSYLRGLKYDQRKNKKHDDDFLLPEAQRHSGRNMIFMLVAAIIVGIVGWLFWQYRDHMFSLGMGDTPPMAQSEEPIIERDSLVLREPQDTIIGDSITLVTNNNLE